MPVFTSLSFVALRSFVWGAAIARCPPLPKRICGICPVSHALAWPRPVICLKGLTYHPPPRNCGSDAYAQLVQSHALSFFLLSGPDLLLGMESDPAKRNLIGLIEAKLSWQGKGSDCVSSVGSDQAFRGSGRTSCLGRFWWSTGTTDSRQAGLDCGEIA